MAGYPEGDKTITLLIMTSIEAKFAPGQIVHHTIFDYRGVIMDVDPFFKGSDDWYGTVARSKPPKDRPWYHVLVDGAEHRTYVAERNLEPDDTGRPIEHPEVGLYFQSLGENGYQPRQKSN